MQWHIKQRICATRAGDATVGGGIEALELDVKMPQRAL